MDADRRSFFFSTTLSEIGFILFFALLLFAFFQRRIDMVAIRDAEAHAEALTTEIAVRKAALAELEKVMAFKTEDERQKFFNELVPRKELAAKNEGLEKQIDDLESKVKLFSALQEKFESASNGDALIKEEIEEALQLKREVEGAIGDEQELDAESIAEALESQKVIEEFNADAGESIKDSEALREALEKSQRVGNLEGQVLNLRGRLGGRDLPPCWANRTTGKIEYLFDVIITDDGLYFASAAPEYRTQEYADLPNTSKLTQGRLDLDQFEVLAKPILKLSNQKQCRHYVAITDRSEISYKATLTIEDYFYKFVNRS